MLRAVLNLIGCPIKNGALFNSLVINPAKLTNNLLWFVGPSFKKTTFGNSSARHGLILNSISLYKFADQDLLILVNMFSANSAKQPTLKVNEAF